MNEYTLGDWYKIDESEDRTNFLFAAPAILNRVFPVIVVCEIPKKHTDETNGDVRYSMFKPRTMTLEEYKMYRYRRGGDIDFFSWNIQRLFDDFDESLDGL